MESLKKIEEVVTATLTVFPETRNSDNILYDYVVRSYNPEVLSKSLSDFLRYFTDYNIPRFESVARCRRRVQEKYPELKGNEDVRAWRKENDSKFRNYAKEINQ